MEHSWAAGFPVWKSDFSDCSDCKTGVIHRFVDTGPPADTIKTGSPTRPDSGREPWPGGGRTAVIVPGEPGVWPRVRLAEADRAVFWQTAHVGEGVAAFLSPLRN